MTTIKSDPPGPAKAKDLDGYRLAIDADGIWTYNDAPLIHPKGLALFKDHLQRQADGSYFVSFGRQQGPVDVADFPYVATVRDLDPRGLLVRWNTLPGDWITPDHLFYTAEGVLGIRVRGGHFPAKFDRNSAAQLGPYLETRLGDSVWYCGPGGDWELAREGF